MMKDSLRSNPAARSAFWDNFKGILIAFVVLGHFLYALSDNSTIGSIVTAIYFFHMPAFVFASGFFGKSKNAQSACSIVKLLSAYLLLTAVHLFLLFFQGGSSFSITSPYYSAWYLLALIFWRMITPYFARSKWSLCVLVIAAILCGFWGDIQNEFAVSRIVAYYPYYLAGYMLSKEDALKIENLPALKRIAVGIISVCIAACIAWFVVNKLDLGYQAAFNPYDYSRLPAHILARILCYIISSLCIIGLMLLTPRAKLSFITKAGRNTLSIYLIHRPLILVLSKLIAKLSLPLVFVAAALFVVVSLLVFGSELVSDLVNKVIGFVTTGFLPSKDNETKVGIGVRAAAIALVFAILAVPLLAYLVKTVF